MAHRKLRPGGTTKDVTTKGPRCGNPTPCPVAREFTTTRRVRVTRAAASIPHARNKTS